MSDSNRLQIAILKETTRGTTPAGNGDIIPVTGESLTGSASTTQSQTIRSDRNVQDHIRTDLDPSGGLNLEIGHNFCNGLYESAFAKTLETPVSLSGTTFSIDASGSPITLDDSGNGLGGLKPYDIIMIQGFTDSNNNGVFSVGANTAAGSVDIVPVSSSSTPTTEAAGDSVTIDATRLTNGTETITHSIEKLFADNSTYFAWLGMEVETMTLTLSAASVPTLAFTFKGNTHPKVSATIFDGYDAAPTSPIMNTTDNYVGTLLALDGAVMASPNQCVTSVTYTVSNNSIRTQGLNCTSLGKGSFNMSVSFTMVFTSQTYYDAFLDDSVGSITSAITDANNNGFGISVPSFKFSQAGAPASGPNQTVVATFEGMAKLSTVGSDNYTAKMCFF